MSLPAAEVAADFRDALQDLRMNSRPEISNLTLIAKENTEYAQAISTELEQHIKSTRPEFKLPALYVLDSIVKNVGTPYTVYLGRNMYRTFMDAYLVMDQGTRKAMEGLLRTWKQPVPESLDNRPVFPADVTQDIENALAKMRNAIQQQVQRPAHALPARPPTTVAWRDTATPPQNMARYAAPNDPRARPQGMPPTPQYGPPMHGNGPPVHYQSPQQQSAPMSSNDLADLKAEIAQLISTTQARFATNFNDPSLRKTLEALLGLKHILDTQTLPPQQLDAVRKQIQALAPPPTPTPTFPPALSLGFPPTAYPPPTPTNAYPQHQPPPSFPPQYPPQYPPTGTPSGSAPPNVAQLLASFRPPAQHTPQPAPTPPSLPPSLAEMLKRMSSPAQSASVPAPAPAPYQPPPFQFPAGMSTPMSFPPAAAPAPAPTGTPTANLAALLAQFSKPGATPPVSQATPVQSTPVPQLPPQPPAASAALGSADWLLKALSSGQGLPFNLNGGPMAAQPMSRQTSAPTNVLDQIELTTASMKKPRFHLISRLYEAKPNICATCGRRFDATAEGKEKKARHMDWHFKVKDPDANKRGVHRSWYIGEKEWIDYREVDETAPPHESTAAAAANKPKKQAKDRYISVPQDPVLQQAPCPICQEKFETQWNVDANDFVWMDALQVGGKVYHATCFEEYSKGAGIPMPGTPDSVLGKRKADLGGELEGKKIRAF
ncbi:hypothetical protein HBI56_021140 [Parastagonospora nodorum]|nr:hypothetical protein HBH51_111390 [Parastagonospora nodorum]KAH3982128.1 hypothetical protein HBH52_074450 [Parastagonospora nodorum]KAH4041246.1 hypothetical protein HBI09_020120 [Parastagonospora nodorum]KAH4291056.1 hypothetical protein HBI01_195040 [Parastagonospora nodorum]KAH4317839.1 hypothetical protein HBI02_019890 [Parastagonospora nodorum]